MVRVLPVVTLIVACGYQSAAAHRSSVFVDAISTQVPYPEISTCLTSELRLGLSTMSKRRGVETYRLEGMLIDAAAAPGAISRPRGGINSVDQVAELTVRARLVHRDRGVVWGPEAYRVQQRGLDMSGPTRSHASAREAVRRACYDIAERIVDDVTFFLSAGDELHQVDR
jgi:hypothetical protein